MGITPVALTSPKRKFTDEPKFGTVVENNDPLRLGRVKVQITGIYEGAVQSLPWVRRKTDTAFCGNNCEIFDVPEIGSVVEVRWSYDENTPIYSGAPYSQKHNTGAFAGNYPNTAGIKFGNCLIKFDKGSQTLTLENGEAQIMLDPFGDCSIACNHLEIKADSHTLIKSPIITLEGDVEVSGNFSCKSGADAIISPNSVVSVSGGLVRSVAP